MPCDLNMMEDSTENIGDKYFKLLEELKCLGVKVPKVKKLISSIPKKDKTPQLSNDKIFGIHLSDQEKTTENDYTLPKFIATSTAYLRKYIEKEIGLFRKAGSVARQRALRAKLENGESIDKSEPNDVASLLKQWLRELPEPLIPSYLHDLFRRCQSLENEDNRTTAVLLACLFLPDDHLQTLKHLLCFLSDIAACSNTNKMGCHNLALIMAPNIFVMRSNCIDKSSNLVQLHTSLIELLIKNADKIGNVPSSVNFLFPFENTLKCDLEFEGSLEILDDISLKPKRRKSGTMQDFLSGIKKLVGQNLASPGVNGLTPNASRTNQSFLSRSAPKRKADVDQLSFSAKKKKAALNHGLQNQSLSFTPKIFGSNSAVSTEKKRSHARKKSFNLLRRKEKNRQKSPKSDTTCESSFHLNVPDTFKENLNNSFQGNLDTKEVFAEALSPLFSPSEIEKIIQKPVNVKKYLSDCDINVTNPFDVTPVLGISSSYSCLSPRSEISPYNLRNNTMQKEISVTPISSQYNFPVRSRSKSNGSSFLEVFESPIPSPKHGLSCNSIIPKSFNLKCVATNKCNNSVETNEMHHFKSEVALEKVESRRKRRSLPLPNEIDVNHLYVDKSSQLCSSVKHVSLKATNNPEINAISSFKRNLNHLSPGNYRGPIRTRYQVSQLKKEANINISLDNYLSQENSKVEPNMDLEASNKENSLSCIESVNMKHKANSVTKVGKKVTNQNVSLCRTNSFKIKSRHSLENISTKDYSVADVSNLNSYNQKWETCDKKIMKQSFRKGTIVRGRPNTVKSGLRSNLCSRFSNETVPSLTNIEVSIEPENGKADMQQHAVTNIQINIQHENDSGKNTGTDTEALDGSLNNSFCFKTPNIDELSKEETWKSGTQCLFENLATPNEVFNKRESIAMIIKNNSGHVQAKISLYDEKKSSDFSTPKVFNTAKNSLKNMKISETCPQKYCHDVYHSCSEYELTPSIMSKKKKSSLKNKPSDYKSCSSVSELNDSLNKMNNFKSPLPYNSTPQVSHPLREVTNELSSHASQRSPYPDIVAKQSVTDLLGSNKLTNKNCIKPKRNSYSGHTPYKLHMVCRSESSPMLYETDGELSTSSLKSSGKKDATQLTTPKNMSYLRRNHVSFPTVKNESSQNFEKIRSDQMLDEWQCEL